MVDTGDDMDMDRDNKLKKQKKEEFASYNTKKIMKVQVYVWCMFGVWTREVKLVLPDQDPSRSSRC